jgi:hypothetical protein
MVISPASGPCDATVEVTGSGFPPPLASPLGPTRDTLGLYLVRPGTADISMDILNAASNQPDGTFGQWLPLHNRGCEAAALDSQSQHPSGYLSFALSGGGPTVQPGERVPNIIAMAHYAYTTTTPQPQSSMTIAPSSGPCDATVEVTGRDFPPSTAIHLDVPEGGGEATLGRLASLTTDPSGGFALSVGLGTLGCQGAQFIEGLGAGPHEFWIFADRQEPVILPGQAGIPPILTRTAYTYTTTVVSGGAPPALPSTGSGPGQPSRPVPWVPLIGGVAALGVILTAASLYIRRVHS